MDKKLKKIVPIIVILLILGLTIFYLEQTNFDADNQEFNFNLLQTKDNR